MKRSCLATGLALAVLALAAAACGDPLNDYRECVRVERARCTLRDKCDPKFDKATCYAYYEEFCRTREIDGELGKSATKEQVDACVAAIEAMDCALLDGAEDDGIDETDLLEECTFAHPQDEPDAGDAG